MFREAMRLNKWPTIDADQRITKAFRCRDPEVSSAQEVPSKVNDAVSKPMTPCVLALDPTAGPPCPGLLGFQPGWVKNLADQ